MTERNELKVGSFYWIMLVLDPDRDEPWEFHEQPARFAGFNAAGEPTWHCLNFEGVDDWPVRWIGPEIILKRG